MTEQWIPHQKMQTLDGHLNMWPRPNADSTASTAVVRMASPNTKKLRLGIFGGSFDPIHVGHLLVATAAREELRLDRLIFVLAAHSPFKPDQKPSPATERLK